MLSPPQPTPPPVQPAPAGPPKLLRRAVDPFPLVPAVKKALRWADLVEQCPDSPPSQPRSGQPLFDLVEFVLATPSPSPRSALTPSYADFVRQTQPAVTPPGRVHQTPHFRPAAIPPMRRCARTPPLRSPRFAAPAGSCPSHQSPGPGWTRVVRRQGHPGASPWLCGQRHDGHSSHPQPSVATRQGTRIHGGPGRLAQRRNSPRAPTPRRGWHSRS